MQSNFSSELPNNLSDKQLEGIRARIVIPARLASTRLPEKLLLCESGQPLIAHTFDAASSTVVNHCINVRIES